MAKARKSRKADVDDKIWFRSDRICEEAGKFYFLSREGLQGPYDDKVEALIKLDKYTKVVECPLLPEEELTIAGH